LYSYSSNIIRFINKTPKRIGFKQKEGKRYSKLFKEKSAFTLTPATPMGVLIGTNKYHVHYPVAYPMAIELLKVVLDNS